MSVFNLVKDENVKVGDIIRYYLWRRHYKIVEVVKITEKSIMFKDCIVSNEEIDCGNGDTETYSTYVSIDNESKTFRKKKEHRSGLGYNHEEYRGYDVFNMSVGIPKCKTGETDIWH